MRTWPPEWTPDMWTGDLWCALTATVDVSARWADPRYTWADERITWNGARPAVPLSPTAGSITRDWAGPSARTEATIEVSLYTPRLDEVGRGAFITIRAHACPLDQAPPDGDPATVPSCVVATLLVTGVQRARRRGVVTLTCDDLVTMLGAIELDTGTGRSGFLPTARTAKNVIRQVAALTGYPQVTVVDRGAPDAVWAPEMDGTTPVPLTGSLWSAIEAMATLAGMHVVGEGQQLLMQPHRESDDMTPIRLTEVAGRGTVTTNSLHEQAPTPTRVIVTGTDAAGLPIAGRAVDVILGETQVFRVDDVSSVPGVTTVEQLELAAAARLAWLRSMTTIGTVETPWLPFLEPGDLVQMMWEIRPRTHYVQSITLPLKPTDPTTLTLRGSGLATWATWRENHNWETLKQESWLTRLKTG